MPIPTDFSLPADLISDTFEHAMDVASQAFLKDIFQTFLTRTYLGLRSEETLTVEHHRKAMNEMFPPYLASGGFLVSSPQVPTATTIWEVMQPSVQEEYHSLKKEQIPIAVAELARVSSPVWRAEFPNGEKVLHLALVGNTATAALPASSSSVSMSSAPKPKGAGYIISEMCQAAKAAGMAVVLEASNAKARDVYTKRGFQLVSEVQAAVGMADETGNVKEGGPGFTLYMMKYV